MAAQAPARPATGFIFPPDEAANLLATYTNTTTKENVSMSLVVKVV